MVSEAPVLIVRLRTCAVPEGITQGLGVPEGITTSKTAVGTKLQDQFVAVNQLLLVTPVHVLVELTVTTFVTPPVVAAQGAAVF